jgi:glycosyltransferase involved in cell wall biosynthesis
LILLIISERFWPEGSGGTLATYLITKLLATCDFKITVITGTCNPTKIEGVNFIIDEAFRIPNKPTRWLYFLRPSVRKRYKDLMRKFDIIYIPYGYPLIPLAKELDKKVIVHLHDYQPIAYNSTILHAHNYQGSLMNDIKAELTYELFEHESIKRAMTGSLFVPITALCKEWINKADVVMCVSRRQAEIISKAAPELANKIRVLYNPLPEISPVEEKFEHPVFAYSVAVATSKVFTSLCKAH